MDRARARGGAGRVWGRGRMEEQGRGSVPLRGRRDAQWDVDGTSFPFMCGLRGAEICGRMQQGMAA